jgi:hypothetical protein
MDQLNHAVDLLIHTLNENIEARVKSLD